MGGFNAVAAYADLPAPGTPPCSVWITCSDGRKLHALDWGGGGPLVLFLHGGGLTAHTWSFACSLLRHKYHCVALDLRGHGDSDWADSYTVQDHVQDIHDVINYFDTDAPHLVGMSLGGIVAAHAGMGINAVETASITLVDIAPDVDFNATNTLRSFMNSDLVKQGVPALIRQARKLGAKQSDAELFYRYSHMVRQLPNGDWRWKLDNRNPFDFNHILAQIKELNTLAAQYPRPCLVIRGGNSRILSNAAGEAFSKLCPDGKFATVPHAGHSVQEDNPIALAEVLSTFWASSRLQ